MTLRRIISSFVAMTLLVSLLLPPMAGARSCGEAARAALEAASPKNPHGYAACARARHVMRTHVLSESSASTLDAGGPILRSQPMLCCCDGHGARRSAVDVPTLSVTAPPLAATLFVSADSWLPAAGAAQRLCVTPFKIGASPPFLAALHQDIYLLSSLLLI